MKCLEGGINLSLVDKVEFMKIIEDGKITWQQLLGHGISQLLKEIGESNEHTNKTPYRFVDALKEYIEGYGIDPKEFLQKSFTEEKYDQMLFMNDISFVSHCVHHLAPFAGKIHFAYIPNKRIVGLSKIPRFIQVLSSRLQIQEQLSDQIVDIFDDVVKPRGCGVVIEAVHFCVCSRGVKKMGSWTRSSSLRGNFRDHTTTKAEFLAGAKRLEGSLL